MIPVVVRPSHRFSFLMRHNCNLILAMLNMKALVSDALRTHGVEDFETEDFKQWLQDRGFIFIDHNGQETSSIRTDLEHLSELADVTVFFYDSKQATRSAAIRNLDSASFSSLQADSESSLTNTS